MKKVYLAGPDVFLPDPKAMADRKKVILDKYGFVGLHPFDHDVDFEKHGMKKASRIIKEANCTMMREADIIIANLTPYHGPSADVGTAYEVGYMEALGKPVYAYANIHRDDHRTLIERVLTHYGSLTETDDGFSRSEDEMAVENFGLFDNLMLAWALTREIVITQVPEKELYMSIEGFETIVGQMAEDAVFDRPRYIPAA